MFFINKRLLLRFIGFRIHGWFLAESVSLMMVAQWWFKISSFPLHLFTGFLPQTVALSLTEKKNQIRLMKSYFILIFTYFEAQIVLDLAGRSPLKLTALYFWRICTVLWHVLTFWHSGVLLVSCLCLSPGSGHSSGERMRVPSFLYPGQTVTFHTVSFLPIW